MTLLEASAGTGKTFTIAALTARYVAEGLPIERLLVITFTRMATGELRERVRDRLVTAFDGLVAVVEGGGTNGGTDEIVALLADAPLDEVVARRDRLGKAIADFDAATIETTHGFCLQVLYGLGTAGDVDREVTLVEDVSDLLEEVVDDLYLRRFAGQADPNRFSREDAVEIARKVLNHPAAAVVPPLSDRRDQPSIRRRFAEAVHKEMERRKRTLKILTYDDVLIRLRSTLRDADRGRLACARLRDRYDVVLVDEFQDTDPVQWEIMHRAFGQGGTVLVLIGDPKQAIYAFRGADVHAYLEAATAVGTPWTLDVNWRSDEGLLEAYDGLFADAQLGAQGIAYRQVSAAPPNRAARLVDAPVAQPLRVRIVHRGDHLVATTQRGEPKAGAARDFIGQDLAAQVVDLLSSGAKVAERHRDGTDAGERFVHPGDLAVLVRANKQAQLVRDALHELGVPAVIGGAGSVFGTTAATEWLRLLEACERPTSRERAALAALTCFVGWTAVQVATADERQWEDLHWSLHRWAALLRDQGVASLFESVSAVHGVPARVLSRPAGERDMTDLRHVGQLLHEAGIADGLGPTALAAWLGRRIEEADHDTENEERTRRLESDAAAVQVLTIHRSKGLEFPIVFCPFMWDGYTHSIDVPVFHDPSKQNIRTIDVSRAGTDFDVHKRMEIDEGRGEDLRLLYVALTRARHQAVLWWAGARDSQHSPLSRLLFDRDNDGIVPSSGSRAKTDSVVESAFAALGDRVSVERVGPPSAVEWQGGGGEDPVLSVALFDRTLDTSWQRVSYSGITRALHEQPPSSSEPEQPLTVDEELPAAAPTALPQPIDALASVPLALGGMPGGTLVGTAIHGVFEHVDFAASDLAAEVERAVASEITWRNVDLGPRRDLVAGLCAAIVSPLGPMVDEVRLCDIARADRLDELGFEIPLIGGDDPQGSLTVGDIADLLEAMLPADDPVARYAPLLRQPELQSVLKGYLTGSLDLVLRLPDGRYALADYKSNRLAGRQEELTAWHYRPEAVEAEMRAAHYPLQALLYCVALHRYLRWRLPDYDPERNMGGVLYLFVRGMSAPSFPRVDGQPCGVWSWQPPASLVVALSDLFDRRPT
jgi:exodeoxyribonuclease V beta subunit